MNSSMSLFSEQPHHPVESRAHMEADAAEVKFGEAEISGKQNGPELFDDLNGQGARRQGPLLSAAAQLLDHPVIRLAQLIDD